MNKETLIKNYSLLKDNLSVVLIVPTLIGGLWQLIALANINTSFIRFFSLTQMIPDGILILFLMTLVYLSLHFFLKPIGLDGFSLKTRKKISIGVSFLLLLFFSFTLWFGFSDFFNAKIKTKRIEIFEIVIFFPLLLLLLGGILISLLDIFYNLKDKFNQIRNVYFVTKVKPVIILFIKPLFTIIAFLFIVKFILLDLYPFYSNFYNRIRFPENLLNTEIIEKKLKAENNYINNPKLLYNNDKYLFYEIVDNENKRKILIIDFEKLVNK